MARRIRAVGAGHLVGPRVERPALSRSQGTQCAESGDARAVRLRAEGNPAKKWSDQWRATGDPAKLTPQDAAAWPRAQTVAQGVLDGHIAGDMTVEVRYIPGSGTGMNLLSVAILVFDGKAIRVVWDHDSDDTWSIAPEAVPGKPNVYRWPI